MAVRALQHLPVTSHRPPPNTNTSSLILSCPAMFKTEPATLVFQPVGITTRQSRRRMPVAKVVEESQESSEPEAASSRQKLSKTEEEEQQQQPPVAQSELASELKKAMQERKEKEGDNLWSGVAEEIREIEWPAFGKVLGTTGVVLSVILGSSVVLLTVNAVLAEFSDRVFAGKGVQDFFT